MQSEAWNKVAQKVDFNLGIDLSKFKSIVPNDAIILDYGCGYGRTCSLLNSAGYTKIVGIDSSIEMIKRGKMKIQIYHSFIVMI